MSRRPGPSRRGPSSLCASILGASAIALALVACDGDDGAGGTGGAAGATTTGAGGRGEGGEAAGGAAAALLDLAGALDADREGVVSVRLVVDGDLAVPILLGGAELILEVDARHAGEIELSVDAAPSSSAASDAPPPSFVSDGGGHWLRPRPVGARDPMLLLRGRGEVSLTAWGRGAPLPAVRRERSLAWLDGALLDDPEVVSLAKVLGAVSDDGHGGRLLDAWFRRFATTAHSERAAPAQLVDRIAAEQGPDPTAWDLSVLPFRVTGVHDRHDLAARSGGCGELRVSIASIDPVVAPLHLLFLFRKPIEDDDVAPDGTVHCLGAVRRAARLSSLDGDAFHAAARSLLDESLSPGSFLLAETVELTVSPWEWRQWVPVGPDALDNPPLFQTVATRAVNTPGPLRDDFLGFVSERAASLDARTEPIPERFRSPSAQVPPSVPAERLSLDGLDPSILAAFPDLARNVEIVGCPTCHTEDAPFVQTSVEREVSPFYDAELDARAARLDLLGVGADLPDPPFGPLSD